MRFINEFLLVKTTASPTFPIYTHRERERERERERVVNLADRLSHCNVRVFDKAIDRTNTFLKIHKTYSGDGSWDLTCILTCVKTDSRIVNVQLTKVLVISYQFWG